MDSGVSLLVKYLSQSLTAKEQEQLLLWRAESEENQQLFSEVTKLRLMHQYQKTDNEAETYAALRKLRATITKRNSRIRFLQIAKYAAAVIAAVFVIGYGFNRLQQPAYTTIIVEKGESVRKIPLSDGSFVWLRDSSELRIPAKFSPTHREVSLIGRAFFDIKKDTHNTFTVKTKSVNVSVLGTTFDLSVDARQKNVEAILVTGKIALRGNANDDVFEVNPGEKVSYNSDKNQYVVKQVDTNTLTSWYLDQITFENATLAEITEKLSVIYNTNITIESEELSKRLYRLVINKDESLTDILNNINYITPITYKKTENGIIINE